MVETSRPSPACPPSDVSAGVGLTGLAGLMAWLLVCRHWGSVADMFALPGPRVALAGPYAALAAVLFSALPMVLWSVLVDKVHRDPATGIDWSRARRLADVARISAVKLFGLWLTWALIGAAYCVARWYWVMPYRFAMQVLGVALVPMVLLSMPYVLWLDRRLVNPRDMAWHFGAFVLGRPGASRAEAARHLRAWTVKGFFTAFMISILPGGFERIVTLDWRGLIGDPVHTSFWLCEGMFLVDVQIAMVGYLLTVKPLAAQIRSAQPRLAGWVAALICYPPFILMNGGGPLDYHGSTADWAFWMQGHTALLWGWGLLLAVLTGIYAWATLAFGLRFSNLTWRGTLTNGPYRFTRHPAYLAKNLFWWASTLPLLVTSHNPVDAVRNTVILAGVSAVYYWRAKTEEAHLLAEDSKYRAYSAWMLEHGLITAPLHRLAKWLARHHEGRALQPAE